MKLCSYSLRSAFIAIVFRSVIGAVVPVLAVGARCVILARSFQSRPVVISAGNTPMLALLGEGGRVREHTDRSSPRRPLPGLTQQNPQSWPWAPSVTRIEDSSPWVFSSHPPSLLVLCSRAGAAGPVWDE